VSFHDTTLPRATLLCNSKRENKSEDEIENQGKDESEDEWNSEGESESENDAFERKYCAEVPANCVIYDDVT
jgi:hypothetical protein